jgi:hypothetical protein
VGFLGATGRARRVRDLVAAARGNHAQAERWLRDAAADFRAGQPMSRSPAWPRPAVRDARTAWRRRRLRIVQSRGMGLRLHVRRTLGS